MQSPSVCETKSPNNFVTMLCEPGTKALKKKPGLGDEESREDF